MERLYQRLKARGAPFEILAVSIDAPLGTQDAVGNVGGDLRAFAKEYGLTFPILHDPILLAVLLAAFWRLWAERSRTPTRASACHEQPTLTPRHGHRLW